MKLTFSYVRAELAKVNCTIRPNDFNEYVVKIKGSPAGENALIDRGHTKESQQDALKDALHEGQVMARTRVTIKI